MSKSYRGDDPIYDHSCELAQKRAAKLTAEAHAEYRWGSMSWLDYEKAKAEIDRVWSEEFDAAHAAMKKRAEAK